MGGAAKAWTTEGKDLGNSSCAPIWGAYREDQVYWNLEVSIAAKS